MSDAISLRHVTYRAGKNFALRDLAMSVPTGSIYGFLGPNGSGKTTTMRMIMGMLPPDDGTVTVLGHEYPHGTTAALARIGYVPERPHLYPQFTVQEMIDFHRAFFPRWDAPRADQLRKQFALRGEQVIQRLSKGETGKLMMLLALATEPELLVLDEPTDGLDPVVRRDVLAALVDYVSTRQATVIVSSHLVHEQERICDYVGVMDDGQLLAEMPMHQFRSGVKKVRVRGAPPVLPAAPFTLLSRDEAMGGVETWAVRGWATGHESFFTSLGAELVEVEDLDLEESFVSLLSSARAARLGLGEVR